MLTKTISAFVIGVEAVPIYIETDVSHGMPSYHIVGQPDSLIKESRERLRLAILHAGCDYPKGRITINMSPAEIRKRGSHFDLAIAMGILTASKQVFDADTGQYCFLGELSLDGSVNATRGILPMVASMKKAGIERVVVPKANGREAMLVPEMTVYGISHLTELVDHFNLKSPMVPMTREPLDIKSHDGKKKRDFAEVKGQESVKRAIAVAVAGGHGLFLMGSPSTGKTMLSERIPTIMPPMNDEEMIETTAVYSVAGLLSEREPCILERPFRQPNQKLTLAGMLGGGGVPKPGEITLANKGVLFLDEVGEFDYRIMDALRVPLEKKEVCLVRSGVQYTYPADFLLVAASNPCPCGYLGDPIHPCRCSASEILRYQKRFSGPIMDRIDLHVHLLPVGYDDLQGEAAMSSAEMRERIEKARVMQKYRYEGTNLTLNHQLDEQSIEQYAPVGTEGECLLATAYDKMKLNPRTLLKVRKVARTIADLAGEEQVQPEHLAEAMQYRGKIS